MRPYHLLGRGRAAGSAYADAVLALSPLAYWRLDEAEGPTAVDISGNGHDGTYENIAAGSFDQGGPLVGQASASVDFDGVDDGVNCGTGPDPGTAAFTLTAWIKSSSFSEFATIIGKRGGSSTWQFHWRFRSGVLNILHNDGSLGGNTVLPTDTWVFAALVYDGTNVTHYLNGQADGSEVVAFDSHPTIDTRIGIQGEGNNPWAGQISEAAMYDSALSAGQIANLYALSGRE